VKAVGAAVLIDAVVELNPLGNHPWVSGLDLVVGRILPLLNLEDPLVVLGRQTGPGVDTRHGLVHVCFHILVGNGIESSQDDCRLEGRRAPSLVGASVRVWLCQMRGPIHAVELLGDLERRKRREEVDGRRAGRGCRGRGLQFGDLVDLAE
jgi:hypothetical protein